MSDPADARPGPEPRGSGGPAAAASSSPSAAHDPPQTDSPSSSTAGSDPSSSSSAASRRRRRGSRGGRNRNRARTDANGSDDSTDPGEAGDFDARDRDGSDPTEVARRPDDLPDRPGEGRAAPDAAERALVRKPRIGDTMPAPPGQTPGRAEPGGERKAADSEGGASRSRRRRRRGGRGRGSGGGGDRPVEFVAGDPLELDDDVLERRRGRERKGRPVGRYLMAVHVTPGATQVAILEGRALIEHYVSRPADDATEIDGNIYLGRVQNVLPGMEAAFIDIGTPKNAVLYRGDVHFDPEDVEVGQPKIEQLLENGQTIVCQVTKNPIGTKGARLTQEVSLPGRFVVLVPNSRTFGISKRLPDDERKRLRAVLDKVRPEGHGVIVRTAAEHVTSEELEADVRRLVHLWEQIEKLGKGSRAPALLYREPDLAVRVIREEFNPNYRGVVIDDPVLFEEVKGYVESVAPALADRVELYDPQDEGLPLFERFHVHEQLHKALDRKVWLPSGGSLIIERTEALTVIDVNTGKNVGKSSLEETVFRNNLEAAEEIARQLRLRDIGGIIVIDFIDMEILGNREKVIRAFRDALARDKTRTQVFDISDLGLVEMTRKRISEGLVESFSSTCPACEGRGLVVDAELLGP